MKVAVEIKVSSDSRNSVSQVEEMYEPHFYLSLKTEVRIQQPPPTFFATGVTLAWNPGTGVGGIERLVGRTGEYLICLS